MQREKTDKEEAYRVELPYSASEPILSEQGRVFNTIHNFNSFRTVGEQAIGECVFEMLKMLDEQNKLLRYHITLLEEEVSLLKQVLQTQKTVVTEKNEQHESMER